MRDFSIESYYSHFREYKEMMVMFTALELTQIGKALVLQEKSVARLAAKEGQPDTVAMEYRKVGAQIGELLKKVGMEIMKLEDAAKPKK